MASEWETVSTSVTDEDGRYKFTGVKSSDVYDVEYRVVFNISPLVSRTLPYQGEDTALDSICFQSMFLALAILQIR